MGYCKILGLLYKFSDKIWCVKIKSAIVVNEVYKCSVSVILTAVCPKKRVGFITDSTSQHANFAF
jgi:hypothetical protein